MKNYIKDFESLLDKSWLKEHVLNLYRIERKQTFPAYIDAAKYTYNLLKSEGFQTEYLEFPADGKTSYQDKRMPIGWDVSEMKLTLLTKVPGVSRTPGISDPVIADFSKNPLSVVKHSVSTPPEGLYVKIITEAQMLAGEDVKGSLVLLNQATRPMMDSLKMLLDLGAVGWVSDFLEDTHTTPDSVNWVNAGTEYNSWHIGADDRDFISFNITPRTGLVLRNACEHGAVKAHIVSDARRYESVLPAVTALLPGESKREVWVLSHLYEPLIDDNSNGVIGSIAILKAIREMAQRGNFKLRYSIRVIFTAEMYGFSAVCEHFGGNVSKRTIGGINTDGILASRNNSQKKSFVITGSPNLPGFAGNIIREKVREHILETYPDFEVTTIENHYGDDCFVSDSSVGCPCVWLRNNNLGLHHNSWLDETVFDVDAMAVHTALCATWIRAMASLSESEAGELLPFAVKRAEEILLEASKQKVRKGTDEKARMEFLFNREKAKISQLSLWGDAGDINNAINNLTCPTSQAESVETDNKWFNYVEGFTFGRIERGFPHDLVKLPKEKRCAMPGGILYSDLADVVSRLDSKKNLKEIITEVEWDNGVIFEDSKIFSYFRTLTMLADAGYLEMETADPLTSDKLVDALKKLGIKEGDTLVVHSALSRLGYVDGGAKAIIKALRTAVGENGTIMAPIFTRPYAGFEGAVNKSYSFRPYDTRKDGALRDKAISTGALSTLMTKEKDSARSNHSTHEWVAIGKDAEELVSGHGMFDAPTGKTSPLDKALKKKATVIFLGCDIGSNTFIHYVETVANAPYLQPAVVSYIDEDGRTKTEFIKNHLPGHRSFYAGENSEFYQTAVKRGLNISSVSFGEGIISKMELENIFDIGMKMFEENPLATLCTNPECTYCRKFR